MPIRAIAAATLGVLLGAASHASAQTVVRWSFGAAPKAGVAAGATFNVDLTATIETSWHLYAQAEPPGGPPPTTIFITSQGPFSLASAVVEPTPTRAMDPNFNIETAYFENSATFTIPVKVAAGTAKGHYPLIVQVTFTTCNDRICYPPKTEEFTTDVGVGVPSNGGSSTGTVIKKGSARGAEQPALGLRRFSGTATAVAPTPVAPTAVATTAVATTSVPATGGAAARVRDLSSASSANTLAAYVSLAAVMAALSLLTPCVFPMVPITVSYFTNRAGPRQGSGRGGSRRDAVRQALIYGLGIVLTFTALGFAVAVAFGASGLNRFAADPWLNLGVTLLFVMFALSLFGVYELAMPSKLLTAVAKADQGKGRYAGTMLMGLAFTLTSFTCTAPFLGTLLVVAAQGNWQWPLVGMLAFSTVFALPFVILALAPRLVASLPKSGTWLIAVKATMGLLEMAAALKFLSNVDLVWRWGIFTRTVVLVGWVVIAIAMVVYLAGLIRLGKAPRLRRPGAGRLVAVAAGIVFGVWLATGLGGRRLGELEAFLPPADLAGGGVNSSELSWIVNDYSGALAEGRRQNRPILVDFTGYTCTNCRWMEANMFPRPAVKAELDRFVRVRLYTDGRGEMYRQFQDMERRLFGTVALPYYAVFRPDGQPVVAFGGLTRNAEEFTAFLKQGLQ